jgi:hypothetical protein
MLNKKEQRIMIGQNLVDFLNEELKENTIVEKLNYLDRMRIVEA